LSVDTISGADKITRDDQKGDSKELFIESSEQNRPEKEYPWIVFAIGGTEYGINSKYVLSIEILGKITPIVDAQSHCPGITKSRGDMINLLDLRALFGLGDYVSAKLDDQDNRHMMLVVESGGKKRGVIVDEVVSVEYIEQFVEGVVGEGAGSVSSQYIRQIAKRKKLDSPLLVIGPEILDSL